MEKNKMRTYDTVTEAVSDLQHRGFIHSFNLCDDGLMCEEDGTHLLPQDFEVDEVYRFEGESDPGDENTVYAISSSKNNLKGILVSAHGAYSDIASEELLKKLHYRE